MRHWKSILYRASLIRRGEIEPVTVEVIVLYTLLFACFVTTVGILVWTVGPALAARWPFSLVRSRAFEGAHGSLGSRSGAVTYAAERSRSVTTRA